MDTVSLQARGIATPTHSSGRSIARTLLGGCLLLLIAFHLIFWAGAVRARNGLDSYARGIDFTATLTGARLIADGRSDELYDLAAQREAQVAVLQPLRNLREGTLLPYIHPPFEAIIYAPLMGLPYGVLYLTWSAAAILAIIAAIACLRIAVPIAGPTGWLLTLAIGSFSPLFQGLWLGQSVAFLLLGLCGAYVAVKADRPWLAGAALALLALKPQLLLSFILLLLLQRRWRPLFACGTILATASAAAALVLGPLWPLQYANFLSGIGRWTGKTHEYPQIMFNWRGLAYNVFGTADRLLVGALSAVTVGALVWAWWRLRASNDEQANDILWSLAVPVAILAAPHLYIHDLALLSLPAWLAVRLIVKRVWSGWQGYTWLILLWLIYLLGLAALFRIEEYPAWPTVPGILVIAAIMGLLVWTTATFTRPTIAAPAGTP